MTRAPYITKDTRRRRLYLLRTNHLTLIKLLMWQKLITPTKNHAYQPNARKPNPALSLMGAAQHVRQFGSRANQLLKSP